MKMGKSIMETLWGKSHKVSKLNSAIFLYVSRTHFRFQWLPVSSATMRIIGSKSNCILFRLFQLLIASNSLAFPISQPIFVPRKIVNQFFRRFNFISFIGLSRSTFYRLLFHEWKRESSVRSKIRHFRYETWEFNVPLELNVRTKIWYAQRLVDCLRLFTHSWNWVD